MHTHVFVCCIAVVQAGVGIFFQQESDGNVYVKTIVSQTRIIAATITTAPISISTYQLFSLNSSTAVVQYYYHNRDNSISAPKQAYVTTAH